MGTTYSIKIKTADAAVNKEKIRADIEKILLLMGFSAARGRRRAGRRRGRARRRRRPGTSRGSRPPALAAWGAAQPAAAPSSCRGRRMPSGGARRRRRPRGHAARLRVGRRASRLRGVGGVGRRRELHVVLTSARVLDLAQGAQ